VDSLSCACLYVLAPDDHVYSTNDKGLGSR